MVCNFCKKPGFITCRNCEVVYYCTPDCQKKDYTAHQRLFCKFFRTRKTFDGWGKKDPLMNADPKNDSNGEIAAFR